MADGKGGSWLTYKKDKKHRGPQPGNVVCVQEGRREGTEEDQRDNTANGANQHKPASSKSINVQGCPGIADNGKTGPASVEKKGRGSRQAKRSIDENTLSKSVIFGRHGTFQRLT